MVENFEKMADFLMVVVLVFKVGFEAGIFEVRSGNSWRNDSTTEVRFNSKFDG